MVLTSILLPPWKQNEDTLRRYRNPLQNPVYEMSDCSIVSPSTCSIITNNSPFEAALQQQPQQHNRKSCVPVMQQQQQSRQNYYSNCSGDDDIFEIERGKGVGAEDPDCGLYVECGAGNGGGGAKSSKSFPTNLADAATGSSINHAVGHHYANLHNSEVSWWRKDQLDY